MAHRRFAGPRKQRMTRTWGVITDLVSGRQNVSLTYTMTGLGGGEVAFQNATGSPQSEDFTLARIFLNYFLVPETTFSFDNQNIAIGIAIVNPGAATSTVNPITDASWDGWMMHQYLVVNGRLVSSDPRHLTSNAFAKPDQLTGQIDVKAKRKIPSGSIIMISLAGEATGTLTDEVNLQFNGRFLILRS